jgi:hypothetical protein
MKRTMMDAIAEARGERLPILAEHGPKPDTFGIELARAALAEGETP